MILRWTIPNSAHLPVKVRCEPVDGGLNQQLYACYRVSDDVYVHGTYMKFLYLTEHDALVAAHQRQEQRAADELRKFDEVCARLAQITELDIGRHLERPPRYAEMMASLTDDDRAQLVEASRSG